MIFVQLSLQILKRDHLEEVKKIYFCNFPILYRQRLLTPQQGQHLRQSSETIFLLMEILISYYKAHLIREIQKNPN